MYFYEFTYIPNQVIIKGILNTDFQTTLTQAYYFLLRPFLSYDTLLILLYTYCPVYYSHRYPFVSTYVI